MKSQPPKAARESRGIDGFKQSDYSVLSELDIYLLEKKEIQIVGRQETVLVLVSQMLVKLSNVTTASKVKTLMTKCWR